MDYEYEGSENEDEDESILAGEPRLRFHTY